jgi:hypothetical protein
MIFDQADERTNLPENSASTLSRRRALGFGALAAGGLLLAPQFAAVAFATGGPNSWLADSGPSPRPNLLLNPSFEDGSPGPIAPSWAFGSPVPVG